MSKQRPAGRNAIIGAVCLVVGFTVQAVSGGVRPTTQLGAILPGFITGLAIVVGIAFLIVSMFQAGLGSRKVTAKDDDGRTPLHYAVLDGDTEVAERLLTKGAEVNAKTNTGETPLDLAKTDAMKALLRKCGAK